MLFSPSYTSLLTSPEKINTKAPLKTALPLANHPTARFYNRITPFYPLIDSILSRYKKPLINRLNSLPSGNLLCMGVGFGNELCQLHKHQITGIDHSEKMLLQARKRNPTIRLEQMNAAETTFEDESFEYIVLAHVLSTGNQSEQILTEAKRLLKKNGKIFILNHFTPNGFLNFFDRFFQPISLLFHFQSTFYLASLPLKEGLKITDNQSIGRWNYYRLLTISAKND